MVIPRIYPHPQKIHVLGRGHDVGHYGQGTKVYTHSNLRDLGANAEGENPGVESA